MKNKKKIITLIGPYSEIGGVSIHIRRLIELLKEKFDFIIINESRTEMNDTKIIHFRKLNLIKYLITIFKSNIIHIHSGSKILMFFHLAIAFIFFKEIIITLHSYRNPSRWLNFLLKIIPDKIIVVNQDIKNVVKTKKSIILNAFIPPMSEENELLNPEIEFLLRQKKTEGKFLIAGNASRIVYYKNNDLYGIDQLIDVVGKFKEESYNIFIIFFVSSLVNCKADFEKYIQQIKNRKLDEYISIIHEQVQFISIIKEVDLVVRPTLIDGDALTIRESLYYNKPVISSDIVKRPEGTILYKTSNVEDLFEKIKFVITEEKKYIHSKKTIEYYKNEYSSLYEIF